MIKQRQMEGVALAKECGVYQGRKPSVTTFQIDKLKHLLSEGVPLTNAAKKVGISRSYYRYLNILNKK